MTPCHVVHDAQKLIPREVVPTHIHNQQRAGQRGI